MILANLMGKEENRVMSSKEKEPVVDLSKILRPYKGK